MCETAKNAAQNLEYPLWLGGAARCFLSFIATREIVDTQAVFHLYWEWAKLQVCGQIYPNVRLAALGLKKLMLSTLEHQPRLAPIETVDSTGEIFPQAYWALEAGKNLRWRVF